MHKGAEGGAVWLVSLSRGAQMPYKPLVETAAASRPWTQIWTLRSIFVTSSPVILINAQVTGNDEEKTSEHH